jgi:hypothetical protein
LQPRRFDAFFGEEFRAALDHFQDRHCDNLNLNASRERLFA